MRTGRGSLGFAEHTLGAAAVVHSVLTANTKTIHQRIFYACPTIRNRSGISERVRTVHDQTCPYVHSGGRHNEHLL
jgi:hypothetical protein